MDTINTIKDLYEWAKKNNSLDLNIGLEYQDGGGTYYGDTYEDGYDSGHTDIYVKIKDNKAIGTYVLLS